MGNFDAALQDVRVLDLTQFTAGPMATLSLAYLGAEIIKIERPGVGEQSRPVGAGQDLKWAVINTNKKGITLNLKSEEGKEILRKLIKVSDVLVENYAPGTIERLGFGYETVKELNPRMIFCQIKGYNDNSPYADYLAMDGAVQCTGTLASQTGIAGLPPVISNFGLADDPAARFTAIAILGALYQRERTGRGQAVRINMQEVVLAMGHSNLFNPDVVQPRGSAMAFAGPKAPTGMYRTKPEFEGDDDNYVFVVVDQNRMWGDLCRVLGREDLLEDPRFASSELRYEHREYLDRIVTEWTSVRTKKEAMKILGENKVIAGAVLSPRDIYESEDVYESGFYRRVDHPSLGQIVVQGSPFHLSDSGFEPVCAPDLGQHNYEVYKELLGIDEKAVSDLTEKGII